MDWQLNASQVFFITARFVETGGVTPVWQVSASQVFFFTILIFGVIGFVRGWRREVVSLAFTLSTLFLLYLNGGLYLARLLFVYLPRIIEFVITQKVPLRPPDPSPELVLTVTFIAFVVLIALGYIIGNRAFLGPKLVGERFLGIIPAIITGFAIILAPAFAGGSLFTVVVQPLQRNLVGNYLLAIFIVAVVALVVGLISASVRKSGGK